MDFQQFIKPEMLILIPVLYFLGIAIKRSGIKDKWIPLILGCFSIILCYVYVLSGKQPGVDVFESIFASITQGILIAGTSVYANQIYVQAKKEE